MIGGLAAMVLLPPIAGMWGPAWMIVPGLGLIVIAYWLTGMVFAAIGRHRVQRLLGEATVWERADMPREVGQALARAVATVDSFFFSPFSRKIPAGRLLAQTARFQLAQAAPESSSDALVGAYLNAYPRDRDAAVQWLDGILAGRGVTQLSHDIAARIGTAHPEDPVIQRMLAKFYLGERRCDFTALQTYQQVMNTDQPLSETLMVDIANLFLSQPRTDSLALKAYLDVYEGGGRDGRLLSAIAACCRVIHPNPLTRPLLKRADSAMAGIDATRRDAMAAAFLPEETDGEPEPFHNGWRTMWTTIGPMMRHNFTDWLGWLSRGMQGTALQLQKTRVWLTSKPFKSMMKWASMAVLSIGVGWLVVNTAMHLAATSRTTENTPVPAVVPVSDPFTLQVAAYLKEGDAQRYTDQLKSQGLEAYWTRASGSGKIWYQVRISHFKTKADARAVGEDLKARQIVGDYYVANYKRPDQP